MRLELTIHDSKGPELNFGDIVEVLGRSYVHGTNHRFFCEITYLPEVESIAPFHTFAFHAFTKIDKVPDGAVKSSEERYNCWFMADTGEDEDEKRPDTSETYLMEWRECEHLLEQKIFRIKFPTPEPKPIHNPKQLSLL